MIVIHVLASIAVKTDESELIHASKMFFVSFMISCELAASRKQLVASIKVVQRVSACFHSKLLASSY